MSITPVPEFLTLPWLQRAVEEIAQAPIKKEYRKLKFDDTDNLTVKYINHVDDGSALVHFQKWHDAQLFSWTQEEQPSDLIIERNLDLEYLCWLGYPDCHKVMTDTLVSVSGSPEKITFPLKPVILTEACMDLYKVKHADFTFQFILTDCPWGGEIEYGIQFVSGIPTTTWLGDKPDELPAPKTGLKCSFAEGLGVFLGLDLSRNMLINSEFIGDYIHLGDMTGLMSRPRINRVVELFGGIAKPYFSLVSRIATLDFSYIRGRLNEPPG